MLVTPCVVVVLVTPCVVRVIAFPYSFSLAIPVTHCVITESDLMPRERTCFANENGDSFDCQGKGKALDINKRNTVYLGQFRTIRESSSLRCPYYNNN